MKKNFTFLITAFMLLMMMVLPGMAVGQTTYNFSSIPTTGWNTNGGSKTINNISWTYSSSTYIGANSSAIQVGSKNNPQTTDWTIQTNISYFGNSKKVTAVSITAYTTATAATYDISVGGESVKSGSLTTSSSTYSASNLNATSGNIVVTLTGSSTSKAMYLSNISVTYEDIPSGPSITVSPTSLTGMSYFHGNGSSEPQSFTVSGSSLTADLNIAAPTHYELRNGTTGEWVDNTSSITLTPTSGTVSNTTIYARLKAGLGIGEYNNENVSITSTGATTKTVSLSGSVSGYTVTYHANGATGGTVPTDATEYEKNDAVTILGNTGTLAKTGYTFANWTKNSDGSGKVYAADDTLKILHNTDLYAKWTINTHTVAMPDADSYGTYTREPSTNPVAFETEVTLTYTPAEGYETYGAKWSVNGEPIPNNGNTFTMPDEDVTVTVVVAEEHGTAINPYTVAQARAAIDANAGGLTNVYTTGIVYESGSVSSNKITYKISDDGTSANGLQVYQGKGINNSNFTSVYDVKPGDIVTVYGTLSLYNSTTYQYNSGNYLVSIKPVIDISATSALSAFQYSLQNAGPSSTQQIKVRGRNLTENLVITAPSDYEICETSDGTYANSLSITTANKDLKTIYVRLKAGLTFGEHNGTITMTSADAVTKTIDLTGNVTGYVVTYNANGGTGTVTDGNNYDVNTEVTVLGHGEMSKTGHNFDHWDTQADDGGTDYAEGAKFNITSNVNLFAQWVPTVYNITKSAMINGNVIVKVGGSEVTSAAYNSTVTLEVAPATNYVLETLTVKKGDDNVTLSPSVSPSNSTYTFTVPAGDVTVSATFRAAWKVEFSVNGSVVPGYTKFIDAGSAIGELPTPSSVPTGFVFKGWTASTDYFNATTPATTITAETVPMANITYAALFCVSTPGETHWTLSNVAPANEECIIVAGIYSSTYYAMNGASKVLFTVSNNEITGTIPTAAQYTVEKNSEHCYLKNGNNYLHLNKNEIKNAGGTTNGNVVFVENGDGFIVKRSDNEKYIKITSSNFTVDDSESNASTLYVFKGISDPDTETNYTTLVTDESISGNTTGETRIFSEIAATADFENNGTIHIYDGGVLNMGSHALTNATAANLVIEDGGQLISNSSVQATVKKSIAGHTRGTTGWNFIATTAVDGTTPTTANGILDATPANYDLFYYDEPYHYWRNYKDNEGHTNNDAGFVSDGGKLLNGKGYLYANANNAELSFEGATVAANKKIDLTLSYSDANLSFRGFNLVGNPFTYQLTSSSEITLNGTDFNTYYMIENGEEIKSTTISETPINPGTGFIVQADAENQHLVFNPDGVSKGERASKPSFIRIDAGNDGFMDRAYIQFGNVNTLRKFTLNDNTPKVYVMNNNLDWAATVINETVGEMPVCFKAVTDGQYTISVKPEGVEVSYLHLIDNIAGTDIDLLATPSYTFNAKGDDYESRFRLVFSSNMANAEMGEDFAFFSNGQLVIANEGEATLQVIDVNGRIVMTESVSGTCSKAINVKAGVYVLRLIQGTDVKTQKIIVK